MRLTLTLLALILTLSSLSLGGTASAQDNSDPLRFPVDTYTEATVTVTTSDGTVEVTYRFYQHIPYVANPVDTDYQSLDVKVPVMIDGVAYDASNAPILLVIPVGGYMSASNAGGSGGAMGGGRPGGGGPGGMGGNTSNVSGTADLALAAGYVVVTPGVRGRDNQAADGTYYGKAPAAIVDLKAAVAYIRYNQGVLPGNSEWIISRGTSAGGALSALLGASGDSDFYDAYLAEIGAADVSDAIFASADYCPITDLDHADMAYEWEFGTTARQGSLVDQTLSAELAAAFADYLNALTLQGANGYGTLSADNYADYLVQTYLIPSANAYLLGLSEDARAAYLASNTWITWADESAAFSFSDFVAHVGRSKGLPAFDSFDLSSAETILFGDATTNARNFTDFSVQQVSGDASATLDPALQTIVDMMNPMTFTTADCSGCADYWWIRHGSSDTDTALSVIANLAISLENQGKAVNTLLYWDAGHGADEDPEAFIAWIAAITGYSR